MKKLLVTFAVFTIGSAAVFAGTKTVPVKAGKDKIIKPVEQLFRANEFDVSIYGAVGLGRLDHYDTVKVFPGPPVNQSPGISVKTTHYTHTAWGGGVEADYFFTRYLGVGIEGDWLAGHDAISSVSSNVIGRYPVEFGTWGFAPYGFIGGGGQFDSQNAGFGQFGIGSEIRFQQHWGIFTDCRWVIHDSGINYALIRSGIRLNF